jgi:hypothetical protein
MVVGLVLSVVSGALIAHPPFSILGAVLLTAATILFAVSATWTMRGSWDPASWPEGRTLSEEKRMRRIRRIAVAECVVAPLMIGSGVWQVLTGGGGWSTVVWGSLLLFQAVQQIRRYDAAATSGRTAPDEVDARWAAPPPGASDADTGLYDGLPKGSPRTWYRLAVAGVVLVVACPLLAGLGADEGLFQTTMIDLSVLGILLALFGVGIAVTKERASAAASADRDPGDGPQT